MENFNEVLRENRTRIERNKRIREQEQHRKEVKEWCLFLFVAAFILFITCIGLFKMDQDNMNNCINKGYDRLVCERNL